MGEHEPVFEHDRHNQPIFNYPNSITSTRIGNIFVGDYCPGCSGREVVLSQGGDITNGYTGHPDINKDHPFKPIDIVSTPIDNVVVKSLNDPVLHIINNQGYPVTCYNTNNIGIFHPYSLASITSGQLCIGCLRTKGITTKEATLYELNISGFLYIIF